MRFSSDPTSRGDEVAAFVRQWYETNRESWWDRHRPGADRKGVHADEFMIGFINEVGRVGQAALASSLKRLKQYMLIRLTHTNAETY
jgi:hypothetical protein